MLGLLLLFLLHKLLLGLLLMLMLLLLRLLLLLLLFQRLPTTFRLPARLRRKMADVMLGLRRVLRYRLR